MKQLLLFLLLPVISFAQGALEERQSIYSHTAPDTYIVGAMNVGYTLKPAAPTLGLQFGIRMENIYLSTGMTVSMKSVTQLSLPFTLGYNIGPVQPFISYSDQTIGTEREAALKGTPDAFVNGWRWGYGLSYYSKKIKHLSVTLQRQGKQTNFSLGMYITH